MDKAEDHAYEGPESFFTKRPSPSGIMSKEQWLKKQQDLEYQKYAERQRKRQEKRKELLNTDPDYLRWRRDRELKKKLSPEDREIVEDIYEHFPEKSPDSIRRILEGQRRRAEQYLLERWGLGPSIDRVDPYAQGDFQEGKTETLRRTLKSGGKLRNKKSGGKVRKKKSGGKVYSNQNKRYAHGGKVSGRKATYKY